jgi:hypothetical protein
MKLPIFLFTSLISSVALLNGCKSEPQKSQICSGEAGTGVAPDCSTPKAPVNVSSTPTPNPVVYDVICFQAMGLGISRTMCSPDDTYKVPRNTQVTVYLKKETSVQQGTNTTVTFDYKNKINNGQIQKITIPEMESLASGGANIYSMYYHNMPVLSGPNQHYVEVELFNNQNGGFKMFEQKSTPVIFMTGDTKIRYKHKPTALESFSQRTGLR